jgi:hypothetical protein
MVRVIASSAAYAALLTLPSVAIAQDSVGGGITILSGVFGKLGSSRQVDMTARLQQFCGQEGTHCDVFCSETSFGRYKISRKAICRVVYRCPDGSTRSAEAAREEPILMRCPALDDVEADNTEPALVPIGR